MAAKYSNAWWRQLETAAAFVSSFLAVTTWIGTYPKATIWQLWLVGMTAGIFGTAVVFSYRKAVKQDHDEGAA
jgi:hypothetical protein